MDALICTRMQKCLRLWNFLETHFSGKISYQRLSQIVNLRSQKKMRAKEYENKLGNDQDENEVETIKRNGLIF